MRKIQTLALDPGHGMGNKSLDVYDGGAYSNDKRTAEAVLAMSLALAIKHYVTQGEDSPSVYLTRTSETDPLPLASRVPRAKLAKADAFLSIHFNSGGARGTETFYREGHPESKEWAEIIQDAALRGLRKAAKLTAEAFEARAKEEEDPEKSSALSAKAARARIWPDRGVKKDSESQHKKLAVLGGSNLFPSCLLEVCFMDSDMDLLIANTRAARIYVATEIAAVVKST